MSSTATSLLGARNSARNVRHSLMWYATTTRMPASVAIGMSAAQRPKHSVMSSSVSAWTMPATGVRPPFLTFVAVRAIAPVAGMPPNSGDTMLATPCATSSMLERCLPPIMPSATTAESSDSIPRQQRDGERGADQRRQRARRMTCGSADAGTPAGWRRSGCRSSRREVEKLDDSRRRRSARRTARDRAGSTRGQTNDDRQREAGHDRRPQGLTLPACGAYAAHLLDEVRRHRAHRQAEEVLDLAREDDHRDAARESGDDRIAG